MSVWLARARVSQRRAATGARAVMRGYERARGLRTVRSGVARYVGIFFVHRAQALSEHAGRVGARATLLATMGERLVVAPELLDTLLAADDA